MSRIVFEKDGTEYTLEFDRRTCEVAESRLGLSLTDVLNGKLTLFPALFQAAFLKNHPKVGHQRIMEIFNDMKNKQALYEALVAMYAECVSTLVDDEGNGTDWTTE